MKQSKKRLKEAHEKVERGASLWFQRLFGLSLTSQMLEREKEARQLALAQQRVAEVKLVEERLPKELDVLRRDLKTQERAATRLSALVSTKRAMAQVRSQELRKAVQCYAEWLALTLEPVRDDKAPPLIFSFFLCCALRVPCQVRFVFTRLVRSQPQREAYIVLQTDATGVTVDEARALSLRLFSPVLTPLV